MFWFGERIYLGVKSLGESHGNSVFIFLRNWPAVFQSYIPISRVWGFCFLPILISDYFFMTFLLQESIVGMKWYLVALICISLMTSDVETLSIYLLTICISIWRIVYPNPLHMFKWNICLYYWIFLSSHFIVFRVSCTKTQKDLALIFILKGFKPVLILAYW